MNKKVMENLYDEYMEKRAMVSDEVRSAYSEMNNLFEMYLGAVQEDEFRNAFMFGYTYGLKAAKEEMKKGGTINV